MPVLAVAVGLYLPFELDSSIFVGGLIAWFLERGYRKMSLAKEGAAKASNAGLLIASGLITGEALMGILIAILASVELNLAVTESGSLTNSWVGLGLLAAIMLYLYYAVRGVARRE